MSQTATSDNVLNAQIPFQAIVPGVSQTITTSGSSTQSALLQNATSIVRLFSTTDCFVAFGTNPTATTSSLFLPGGIIDYVGIPEQQKYKIAAIQSTAAGKLYITEGA